MDFDRYYELLQKRSNTCKVNPIQFCQRHGITLQEFNQHRASFVALLNSKLNHIKDIVDLKITDITTNGFGLNNIHSVRDFYHYYYYYFFFKSRALLVKRDNFDCCRHQYIKDRLNLLITPHTNDPALNWLTHKFDTYEELRIQADYKFDDSSINDLVKPQTIQDAVGIDWADLQGITI